jgi:hypothetical protein
MLKLIASLFVLHALLVLPVCGEDLAGNSEEDVDFFEARIRPVLIEHCQECHSGGKNQKGGLNLSFRDGLRRGGDSGAVIVPGKANESLLIQALKYESLEMPPKEKLPDRVIADFEKWIQMGAPDPRTTGAGASPGDSSFPLKASQLWSLQPLKVVEPPEVSEADTPIDRFVRARLLSEKIPPSEPAEPRVLLRRLYLDLTGLPPTRSQFAAFEASINAADSSGEERTTRIAKAVGKVVDELLQSPEFGERWARHWLDLTAYADTIGVGRTIPALEAWRYRDYVISSFNSDKPFDEFIRQQIAGDIQIPSAPSVPKGPPPTAEGIIATGFLAIGPWELVGGDKPQLRMDVVDRQVNRVGKAFLGLTLECARCHAHKFDPISHEDYYALAGIFRSTVTLNGRINGVFSAINQSALPETSEDLLARAERVGRFQQEWDDETRERDKASAEAADLTQQIDLLKKKPADEDSSATAKEAAASEPKKLKTEKLKELTMQRDAAKARAAQHSGRLSALDYLRRHRTEALALAVMDTPEPEDAHINIRGNAHQLGPLVPRGFPSEIAPRGKPAFTRGGSGRVQLAEWIADERNPLTARVWVNRVWNHLFGFGLVRSVDNFGARGEKPDHPELLDFLAAEFMKDGWSTRNLIRRIVLSRTWQQASFSRAGVNAGANERDPGNRLLWRANRRRLEAEAIRDAMLNVSGQLDTKRGGPTLPVDVPGNFNPGSTGSLSDASRFPEDLKNRRSIYLPQKRKSPFDEMDLLGAFDLPDPGQESGRRAVTTVPTQALFLLNSPFVQDCATAMAKRFLETDTEPRERVSSIYRSVYGRPPSDTEANDALQFTSELRTSAGKNSADNTATDKTKSDNSAAVSEQQAWARLCQSLLISNEFLFRD